MAGRFDRGAGFHSVWGVLKAKFGNGFPGTCAGAHRATILAVGLILMPAGGHAQHYHPNELIAADPVTGAAMLGYDAVGYFLEGTARPGLSRHQANFGGKVWYFVSEANRAAFLANPGAYIPEFGGYDPVAAARGIPVAGNPAFHAIRNERLYLFRNAETRTQFLGDPTLASLALRNWPEVKRGLSP